MLPSGVKDFGRVLIKGPRVEVGLMKGHGAGAMSFFWKVVEHFRFTSMVTW